MWKLVLIACFTMTALSGCAFEQVSTARNAQATLIGKQKAEILSCAGAPNGAYVQGQLEVLTYAQTEMCKADFIFDRGILTKINYAGPTPGLFGAASGISPECSYLVRNCVGH